MNHIYMEKMQIKIINYLHLVNSIIMKLKISRYSQFHKPYIFFYIHIYICPILRKKILNIIYFLINLQNDYSRFSF